MGFFRKTLLEAVVSFEGNNLFINAEVFLKRNRGEFATKQIDKHTQLLQPVIGAICIVRKVKKALEFGKSLECHDIRNLMDSELLWPITLAVGQSDEWHPINRLTSALVTFRERTIRALTDTIRYEYSSVHNGRYRYRYEYSLCHGVPATYIIRTGRSLRERSLYAMGGTLQPRLNNADH